MNVRYVVCWAIPLAVSLAACGGGTETGNTGGSGGAGTGGAGTSSSSSSTSTSSTSTNSSSTSSTSTSSSSSSTSSGSSACTTARDQALGPIDMVSAGEVTVLSTAGTAKTLFVNASAGGTMAAAQNPWIYVDLKEGKRVDVTDPGSFTSTAWDLGIKRPLLRTNSGDGGPGQGGAVFLEGKTFDAVTAADAASATIATEQWFDAQCNLTTDPTGAIATTFAGWYDYDQATNKLTPHAGVFIVRGADGSLYKLAIDDYYANPDGTSGMAGGRYKIQVGPLQ